MTQRQKNESLITRLGRVDFTPPWSLVSAALTIAFGMIMIIVGSTFAFVWIGEGTATAVVGWAVGCIFMALMVWQTRAKDRAALMLNAPRTPLALILFISIGTAVAIDIVGLALTSAFLPAPELLGINLAALNVRDILLAVLFLVVAQPLGEELIYRGVALPAFRAALGSWLGLVVTAAVYGVFHWLSYPPAYNATYGAFAPYWYGLIAPILAGLYFGAVRILSGSTRAAIAAHAAFGLFAIIKLLVLAN